MVMWKFEWVWCIRPILRWHFPATRGSRIVRSSSPFSTRWLRSRLQCRHYSSRNQRNGPSRAFLSTRRSSTTRCMRFFRLTKLSLYTTFMPEVVCQLVYHHLVIQLSHLPPLPHQQNPKRLVPVRPNANQPWVTSQMLTSYDMIKVKPAEQAFTPHICFQ